jgi:hypothetical protein
MEAMKVQEKEVARQQAKEARVSRQKVRRLKRPAKV